MSKTVYIETSIVSYLTARPSRDVRVSAWQQLTWQWWHEARAEYELFTPELVVVEASGGDGSRRPPPRIPGGSPGVAHR